MVAIREGNHHITNRSAASSAPGTPHRSKFPAGSVSEENSECWLEAKKRFQERMRNIKHPPSQQNIDDFLTNNVNVNKAIIECEKLKSKADRRYDGSLGKLLQVLSVLKDVGDQVLVCAPESVSIAWGIISIFIGIGANDMENCGQISEASTNIVTIILNCRLYENRMRKKTEGLEEVANRVMESINELITAILEFFWFANRKFRENNKLKKFGDIFNVKSTVNEKYETVVNQYKDLRSLEKLEFEENIMGWLHDMKHENSKLAEMLQAGDDSMRAIILPGLSEINAKLGEIREELKDIKSEVKEVGEHLKRANVEQEIREDFAKRYKALKPSDTHQRQYVTILEPLRQKGGTEHLSQWLFTNKSFISWEQETGSGQNSVSNVLRPDPIEPKLPTEAVDAEDVPIPHSLAPEGVSIPKLFYIKGQAGFGKSVTVALAIERLMTRSVDHFQSEDKPTSKLFSQERKKVFIDVGDSAPSESPVLYFFFKKGDSATELTDRATASLLTQLVDSSFADSLEKMESFLKVTETDPKKKTEIHKMGADDSEGVDGGRTAKTVHAENEPGQPSDSVSIKDLIKLETLAEIVGKTVYIVLDGIDECKDYAATNLIEELIKLARSKKASIKIMMSSREGLELESLFTNDEEGLNILKPSEEDVSEEANSLRCVSYKDTTMLTVTKYTNEEDMKAYLLRSLTELMNREPPGMHSKIERHSTPSGGFLSEKQAKAIEKMVNRIQKKAEGMFTYSAMVIASLDQPSPLSIRKRVKKLPEQMDSLYARHLESLTSAQRRLITLALKRVVWGPADMNTLEIVDEFKQEWLVSNDKADEGDSDSEPEDDVSAHGDDPGGNEAGLIKDPAENIERALRRPEVIYTIYHLESAGREFFKFSNGRHNIDVVHKSVRDWVENESQKAEERYATSLPIGDIFQWDGGEIKVTIPRLFVEGHSIATDFNSEKETQLDILLYIFDVILNPKFQEQYMTLYSALLREYEKTKSLAPEKETEERPSNSDGTVQLSPIFNKQDALPSEPILEGDGVDTSAQPKIVTETDNNSTPSETKEPKDVEKATVESQEKIRGDDNNNLDTPPRVKLEDMDDQKPKGVLMVNTNDPTTHDASPLDSSRGVATDSPSAARGNDPVEENMAVDSKSLFDHVSEDKVVMPAVTDHRSDDIKDRKEDNIGSEEAEQKSNLKEVNRVEFQERPEVGGEYELLPTEENVHQQYYDLTSADLAPPSVDDSENENNLDPVNEPVTETEEIDTKKNLHRGELHHWVHHMRRLAELWPREARQGKKWKKLNEQLRKFTAPDMWLKWQVQWRQFDADAYVPVDLADTITGILGPGHIASIEGLEILFDFLLDDETINYDFNRVWAKYNRNLLHMAKMAQHPDIVGRLIEEKKVDINLRDTESRTPLEWYVADYSDAGTADLREKILKSIGFLVRGGAYLGSNPSGVIDPPLCSILSLNGGIEIILAALDRDDVSEFINVTDWYSETLLHKVFGVAPFLTPAPSPDQLAELAKKLLEKGADPNAQNTNSAGPLSIAASACNVEGVKLLVEAGANVNDDDAQGMTAICNASFFWNEDRLGSVLPIIKILYEAGADFKKRTKMGVSPLAAAVQANGAWDIAKLLLELHAKDTQDHSYLLQRDINERGLIDIALDNAAGENALRIAELMAEKLDRDQWCEATQKKNFSRLDSLENSIFKSNEELTRFLVQSYAKKMLQDQDYQVIGEQYIRRYVYAILTDCPSVFELFKSKEWETVYETCLKDDSFCAGLLRTAIATRSSTVIEELVEAGVDPFKIDDENYDAYDWAYAFGQQESIQKYFPKHNVDFENRKMSWEGRFKTPTRWSQRRAGGDIEYSEDGLQISLAQEDSSSMKWGTVVANHSIPPYKSIFYYEVTILGAPNESYVSTAIGFSVEEPLHKRTEWNPCFVGSYEYSGVTGACYTPEKSRKDYQNHWMPDDGSRTSYGVGDVIGCGYNQTNHVMFWTLNGRYLGDIFKDVKGKFIPIAGGTDWWKISTNFGSDPNIPFKWDGKVPLPEETSEGNATATSEIPQKSNDDHKGGLENRDSISNEAAAVDEKQTGDSE